MTPATHATAKERTDDLAHRLANLSFGILYAAASFKLFTIPPQAHGWDLFWIYVGAYMCLVEACRDISDAFTGHKRTAR